MAKNPTQERPEIIIRTDSRVVDLQAFVRDKKGRPEVVGTATLRVQDLPDVVALLTERLQVSEYFGPAQAAAKKLKKRKAKTGIRDLRVNPRIPVRTIRHALPRPAQDL